jgi:hypothetical protein
MIICDDIDLNSFKDLIDGKLCLINLSQIVLETNVSFYGPNPQIHYMFLQKFVFTIVILVSVNLCE